MSTWLAPFRPRSSLALGDDRGGAIGFLQLEGNVFKVAGLPAAALRVPAAGWQSVFVVYAGAGDVPPLAGSYAVENGTLVFRPTFPLAAGPRYRAVFRGAGAPIEKTFDGPARSVTPSARVERVYPSADVLPSNQLRLYIYFSTPDEPRRSRAAHSRPRRGRQTVARHVPSRTGTVGSEQPRLTMTFDPGRIKRDLTSNKAMGPPIAEGKRYTLLIDREWRDANGVAMVEPFKKAFRGGPQCVSRPIRRRGDSRRLPQVHGSPPGRLRPADELHADAADAEGGWRARRCRGQHCRRPRGIRVALHAAESLERGRLPV